MLYVNPLAQDLALNRANPNDAIREQRALKELEHVFIFMLLSEMRRTTESGGIFGKSPEMTHFTEMMDDALSAAMAESGQFGIAKTLAEQLRQQEMQRELNTPSEALGG